MALEDLVFQIKADASKFSKEIRKASDDFERFQRSSRFARRDALDFVQSAGEITAAVTAIGAALAANALRETANFRQALARVGAVSNATADQLDELEGVARQAGATTQFSAQEAAEGLGFLAQAGFDVQEQIESLPGVLNLAAAGSLDLAEASDIASNVLSGFNLRVSELARVNDVLAAAASSSNTDIQQLGKALSFAAPVASSLSISIEETAATIGLFSDAGIQASRAGTALRTILAKLQDASKQLGAGLTPARIEALGFAGSLEQLQGAGLNAQNAVEVFGTEAGPALAALLQRGTGALEDMSEKFRNADGAAQDMAERLRDTLSGDVKELRSAIGELNLTFGDFSGPTARAAIQALTGLTRSASENEEAFKGLGDSTIQLAEDLKIFVDIAAVLLATIRNLVAVGQTIVGVFEILIASVTDLILGATELGVKIGEVTTGFLGFEEKAQAAADAVAEINRLQQQFAESTYESAINDVGQAWEDAAGTGQSLGRGADAANAALTDFQKRARAAKEEAKELAREQEKAAQAFVPPNQGPQFYEGFGLLADGFRETDARMEGFLNSQKKVNDEADTTRSKWSKLAEQVREATISPQEELQRELEDLDELLDRGLISVEQFYVRAEQLEEEFRSDSERQLREFAGRQLDSLVGPFEQYEQQITQATRALEQGLVTQQQFNEIVDQLDPSAGLEDRLGSLGAGGLVDNLDQLQEQFRQGQIGAEEFRKGVSRIREQSETFADLKRGAEQVKGSLRTAGDEARIQKQRLEAMLEQGLITQSEFRRTVERINADLEEQRGQLALDLIGEAQSETAQLAQIGESVAKTLSQNFETFFFDVFEGNAEQAGKKLAAELLKAAAVASVRTGIGALFGGGGGGGLPGFAEGGFVSGPGTSTSDSIPARLSDGEYVINAAATREYGTALLDSINSRTLSRNAQPTGYANGGAVGGGLAQRIALFDDRQRLEDFLTSSQGERLVVRAIGNNSEEVNTIVGAGS